MRLMLCWARRGREHGEDRSRCFGFQKSIRGLVVSGSSWAARFCSSDCVEDCWGIFRTNGRTRPLSLFASQTHRFNRFVQFYVSITFIWGGSCLVLALVEPSSRQTKNLVSQISSQAKILRFVEFRSNRVYVRVYVRYYSSAPPAKMMLMRRTSTNGFSKPALSEKARSRSGMGHHVFHVRGFRREYVLRSLGQEEAHSPFKRG